MKKETPFNTPEGALKVFSIFDEQIKGHGFDVTEKTILHIGAGDLIGVDCLFLLSGARRVISLDLRRRRYNYPEISYQSPFFEALWELAVKEGISSSSSPWAEIIRFEENRTTYNTDRLFRLVPSDAAYLPIKDNCVDFVFSNAVLEHVNSPEKVIQEISRVLKPWGDTMHRVDLRDHQNFSRPLEFLKPGRSRGGCNLWRAHQFEASFRQHGLTILDFEVFDLCRVTEQERSLFEPEFAGLSCRQLGQLRFMIYSRLMVQVNSS